MSTDVYFQVLYSLLYSKFNSKIHSILREDWTKGVHLRVYCLLLFALVCFLFVSYLFHIFFLLYARFRLDIRSSIKIAQCYTVFSHWMQLKLDTKQDKKPNLRLYFITLKLRQVYAVWHKYSNMAIRYCTEQSTSVNRYICCIIIFTSITFIRHLIGVYLKFDGNFRGTIDRNFPMLFP